MRGPISVSLIARRGAGRSAARQTARAQGADKTTAVSPRLSHETSTVGARASGSALAQSSHRQRKANKIPAAINLKRGHSSPTPVTIETREQLSAIGSRKTG